MIRGLTCRISSQIARQRLVCGVRYQSSTAELIDAEANLKKVLTRMGLSELPPAGKPGGLYRPTLRDGQLLYVSGQPPLDPEGNRILGICSSADDIPLAKDAAACNALAVLAAIRVEVKDLNKIERIVKSLGMVNCTLDFKNPPQVIDGYSEVMRDVFGPDNGVGVRSAIGAVLPGNIYIYIYIYMMC